VEGLTAGYAGNVVLEDISFEVRRGEVLVILGGSGSGKSTLLKHMIGLYPPLAGRVLFEGVDLVRAEGERRRAILRSFGVMYQRGALFGSMSLLENVRLPLEEYTDLGEEEINLIARIKLAQVQLSGSEELLPAELSGGMQKRAAIARALALDPKILFLDEPSAGLDPVTSAELDQLILQVSDSLGMTFVVVSHELASIFAIADRVIMLDRRKRGIVAQGDPRELRDHSDDPGVRRFFHREPQLEPA
jgi:phospholipid/cholesterol/gamma-HCH transport system ATP-binding protein